MRMQKRINCLLGKEENGDALFKKRLYKACQTKLRQNQAPPLNQGWARLSTMRNRFPIASSSIRDRA